MSNEWKDRIIQGGAIIVSTLGLMGCLIGMVGFAAGQPGALRGGAMVLVTASLIGAACLAAVNFPSRRPRRRRRLRDRPRPHRPRGRSRWKRVGSRRTTRTSSRRTGSVGSRTTT